MLKASKLIRLQLQLDWKSYTVYFWAAVFFLEKTCLQPRTLSQGPQSLMVLNCWHSGDGFNPEDKYISNLWKCHRCVMLSACLLQAPISYSLKCTRSLSYVFKQYLTSSEIVISNLYLLRLTTVSYCHYIWVGLHKWMLWPYLIIALTKMMLETNLQYDFWKEIEWKAVLWHSSSSIGRKLNRHNCLFVLIHNNFEDRCDIFGGRNSIFTGLYLGDYAEKTGRE